MMSSDAHVPGLPLAALDSRQQGRPGRTELLDKPKMKLEDDMDMGQLSLTFGIGTGVLKGPIRLLYLRSHPGICRRHHSN